MREEATMRTILTFAMAAMLAVPALAADFDGKWKGTMPSRDGNAREVSFLFHSEGAALTGNFIGPMGREVAISDGKIEGEALSFSVSVDFNGSMVKIRYNGKLSGEDLTMKMQREGATRSVEFSLKKAGS